MAVVNFDLLAQLKRAGIKQIEFSVAGEMRLVEFFDPRVEAEASVAQIVAKQLDDGPEEALKTIKRIHEDEDIPEPVRQRLAEQMRSRLIYGSSG